MDFRLSRKGLFGSSRGLRQGDLLSPLLFTLVVDGLSELMARAKVRWIIEGYNMVMRVSQLIIYSL